MIDCPFCELKSKQDPERFLCVAPENVVDSWGHANTYSQSYPFRQLFVHQESSLMQSYHWALFCFSFAFSATTVAAALLTRSPFPFFLDDSAFAFTSFFPPLLLSSWPSSYSISPIVLFLLPLPLLMFIFWSSPEHFTLKLVPLTSSQMRARSCKLSST